VLVDELLLDEDADDELLELLLLELLELLLLQQQLLLMLSRRSIQDLTIKK
jgi:hypothetical protein